MPMVALGVRTTTVDLPILLILPVTIRSTPLVYIILYSLQVYPNRPMSRGNPLDVALHAWHGR